jgi:hypothetical protein
MLEMQYDTLEVVDQRRGRPSERDVPDRQLMIV